MANIPNKYLLNLFLFLVCACSSSPYTNEQTGEEVNSNSNASGDTLRVYCTKDQHHLTCQWMKSYQEDHKGIHTRVLMYKNSIPPGEISSEKDGLFMVMESPAKNIPEYCWRIKYARDGIIGIVNEANPYFENIMESGPGIKELTSLKPGSVKVFVCSDSMSTCKILADYLKVNPAEFRIITTEKALDIIDSVRLDPLSIGLCCQRYAYDLLTRQEIPEINIIALDCNGNGILEKKEKFYNNLDELRRAMWSGKYPCHSFLNHYIVAAAEPTNKLHIDFMKWVMTEGQLQLESEGYVLLRMRIIKEEIEKLNDLKSTHAFTLLY